MGRNHTIRWRLPSDRFSSQTLSNLNKASTHIQVSFIHPISAYLLSILYTPSTSVDAGKTNKKHKTFHYQKTIFKRWVCIKIFFTIGMLLEVNIKWVRKIEERSSQWGDHWEDPYSIPVGGPAELCGGKKLNEELRSWSLT